jgi:hypothetical protein
VTIPTFTLFDLDGVAWILTLPDWVAGFISASLIPRRVIALLWAGSGQIQVGTSLVSIEAKPNPFSCMPSVTCHPVETHPILLDSLSSEKPISGIDM